MFEIRKIVFKIDVLDACFVAIRFKINHIQIKCHVRVYACTWQTLSLLLRYRFH